MLKIFWLRTPARLFLQPIKKCPVRLSARTAPFHGAKTGSIPVPGTKPSTVNVGGFFICAFAGVITCKEQFIENFIL